MINFFVIAIFSLAIGYVVGKRVTVRTSGAGDVSFTGLLTLEANRPAKFATSRSAFLKPNFLTLLSVAVTVALVALIVATVALDIASILDTLFVMGLPLLASVWMATNCFWLSRLDR